MKKKLPIPEYHVTFRNKEEETEFKKKGGFMCNNIFVKKLGPNNPEITIKF